MTKDYVLKVRITALERAALEQAADAEGGNKSDIVRQALALYFRTIQPETKNPA